MREDTIQTLRSLAMRLHMPHSIGKALKYLLIMILRLVAFPMTRGRIYARRHIDKRYLEIGPGPVRIPGFETLNIHADLHIDYVLNASRPFPFADGTFDIVYASHVLEHIPWYRTEEVLQEWVRILKPGGVLELCVPDAVKICQTLVNAEIEGVDETSRDGFYRFNPRRDPCVWASDRLYCCGDGRGGTNHPHWHRALFTERYLRDLLTQEGLVNIEVMNHWEARGHDHGWINLGLRATKASKC